MERPRPRSSREAHSPTRAAAKQARRGSPKLFKNTVKRRFHTIEIFFFLFISSKKQYYLLKI
jgi:hypothetical protein